MNRGQQESHSSRPAAWSKLVSLAAMSALVVAIGMLLTFMTPRLLSGAKGPTAAPPPTKALVPTPTAELDLRSPTPAPVSKVYQLKVDADGNLAEGVQVVSDDGNAILRLNSGTRVLDADGQPAASIAVTGVQLNVRRDVGIVGLAYEFLPAGATLDPPGTLSVIYDPGAYYPFKYLQPGLTYTPTWQNNGRVYVAYMDQSGALSPFLVSVDSSARSAAATLNYLGTIILYVV